ncbi:hypothetical protein IW967_00625 [Alicyclobacillus mali]|uniref:Transmembrane protein n=1 Tax=Alicyclobacillus mali (ex Roth et al. 2021) TaxID=1123961 RepID=A0ABS0EZB7_9BACL|nr:hypothetical protein [Alicyclobacillus mali (ex Roth et al. 2021)]MBF8376394.1 hypothetical protein [Alicyclobacillus mali (ex Roth et al. 2021)]MCL6488908.1 hypothetical protein [Alicyclobacillus mali (ex Roth et al. 2021)]
MRNALMLLWLVPAALWLWLWPPLSIVPRWLVRAAIAGCLVAWFVRWLIPAWLPPAVWSALSAYELLRLSRTGWRWVRVSAGLAIAGIAAMVAWPRMAPFAAWAGVPPEVWAAGGVGLAMSVVSPSAQTRALVSVGFVVIEWTLRGDGWEMAAVFVFAAAFELTRALAGALSRRGASGEEAGD